MLSKQYIRDICSMVHDRITKIQENPVQMMLVTSQKKFSKISKISKTVDFLPVSSFKICFRKSPTRTPTMLKICVQGLFLIANKMAIQFFSNSNFLVF